jgi:hypothetical protein
VKPTPEQLGIIRDEMVRLSRGSVAYTLGAAEILWSLIAPLVLEEAAKVCNRVAMEYERRHEQHGALLCEDRIRALKGEP